MPKINIIQDLRNCTSSITTPTIELPEGNYRIDFKANEGYEFKGRNRGLLTGATVSYDNLQVTPDYASIKKQDKQNGYIEWDSLKLIDNTKNGVINLLVPAVRYFEESTLILELENCTIDYKEPTIPTGRIDLTITVNSDENCVFEENGYWVDSSEPEKRNPIEVFRNNTSTSFTIQIAKGEFITIHLEAKSTITPEPDIPKPTSFVNIFTPTEEELKLLSTKRFPVGDPNRPFEMFDFGMFISQLYRTPFKIPDTSIGEKQRIKLGNLDSLIDSYSIITEFYTIDLGIIEIPEKYNNAYDYLNTTCLLHVPYSNPIELNPEYIINKKIRIELLVNVYNGNSTINIYSNFTEKLVYSETVLTGTKIPFMQTQNNTYVNEVSQPVYNEINRCYIEIIRNIPYEIENVFGKPTVDYGKLLKYSGYIEVGNIILNTTATQEEKTEIENILQQGVYIND